jgi:Zn-finger nucleic acid-binding protein
MKCPHCPDTTLVMSERQGIEIDYCPACRGLWLDRGELDKLLERAAAAVPQAPTASPRPPAKPDYQDSDHRSSPHYPRYRKKSWLDDIFD